MEGPTVSPVDDPRAPAEVVSLDARRARARRQAAALTSRELLVLAALASGQTTEEVARSNYLSPHTIRSHVKSATRKVGARTRTHAVAIALSEGAIELGDTELSA